MKEQLRFEVGENQSGKRIDIFLTGVSEFSRSYFRKLIKDNCVSVNGKRIKKPSHPVRSFDEVVIAIPDNEPSALEAKGAPLHIYFEDEYLIVVEKPAHMVTHPTPTRKKGTLVNALLAHFHEGLSDAGGTLRPGIVHRLDEDTSGIIIVAKTNVAHAKLSDLFRERKVHKTYTALVTGKLTPLKGSIEAPIMRSSDTTRMMVSGSKRARPALTHYEVVEYPANAYTLAQVNIVTGRTHQIRVHFLAISHPVVGDKKYGYPKTNEEFSERFGLDRQFLHASKLSFTHPFTGEELHFESPLPPDLSKVLEGLK
jgi:23S rRNA pseudouridine1911/1915/1917 synthase